MNSSLISSDLFVACLSCYINFVLSHSLLGSDDKNLVQIPEAMIAGDLGNFIIDLSLLLFHPCCLILKLIFFPKS